MKPAQPTPAALDEAARRLRAGELVVFPTETVYGLGADAGQAEAVAAIYALKGRPADHPLIVHVPDVQHARAWAQFGPQADTLAQAFWPGPLTMVLPRLAQAAPWACGGEPTVGLRCPAHPVAQALLERFVALGGLGVAAPSANRFGRVSPTRAEHVIADLGPQTPFLLDAGPCAVGVESTLIDLSRAAPVLLRPGRIRREAIEAVLGEPVRDRDAAAPRASGTLASHYCPDTPLVLAPPGGLEAALARAREAAGAALPVAVFALRASARCAGMPQVHAEDAPAGAPAFEAALYDALRRLDRLGLARIVVELPAAGPEWEAVLDRLQRAATRPAGH